MYHSEKEIINGCVRRKRGAQKALYEKYQGFLLGVCIRYAKERAEAEDILLEGFARIFKKIHTFKGNGSFEGWMRRIMVNTAIDNFRKNKKYYYHAELENTINDIAYSVEITDNLTQKELLKTIQELPTGYRTVFNLFVIEGYSHKEIAEVLNISVSTSKTQLLKAKRSLAEKIERINMVDNKEVNKNER